MAASYGATAAGALATRERVGYGREVVHNFERPPHALNAIDAAIFAGGNPLQHRSEAALMQTSSRLRDAAAAGFIPDLSSTDYDGYFGGASSAGGALQRRVNAVVSAHGGKISAAFESGSGGGKVGVDTTGLAKILRRAQQLRDAHATYLAQLYAKQDEIGVGHFYSRANFKSMMRRGAVPSFAEKHADATTTAMLQLRKKTRSIGKVL